LNHNNGIVVLDNFPISNNKEGVTMKHRKTVLFLLAGIMIAGILSGCASTAKVVTKAPPVVVVLPSVLPSTDITEPEEEEQEEDVLPPVLQKQENDIPVRQQPVSEIPLAPITREIIQLISRSGNTLDKLQYFLSGNLVLEDEKNTQTVDINEKGEMILRNSSIREQVAFNPLAGGVLVDSHHGENERIILEIGFDGEHAGYTLSFIENQSSQIFDLLYNHGDGEFRTINYGGETYQISTENEVPHLLIRLETAPSNESINRELTGRYLSPKF
jgi:hypothetical protein